MIISNQPEHLFYYTRRVPIVVKDHTNTTTELARNTVQDDLTWKTALIEARARRDAEAEEASRRAQVEREALLMQQGNALALVLEMVLARPFNGLVSNEWTSPDGYTFRLVSARNERHQVDFNEATRDGEPVYRFSFQVIREPDASEFPDVWTNEHWTGAYRTVDTGGQWLTVGQIAERVRPDLADALDGVDADYERLREAFQRSEARAAEAAEARGYWALINMTGHKKIAGYCSEVTVCGLRVLRVDVPPTDGQPLGLYHLVNMRNVFSIVPLEEEHARRIAEELDVQPVDSHLFGHAVNSDYTPPIYAMLETDHA